MITQTLTTHNVNGGIDMNNFDLIFPSQGQNLVLAPGEGLLCIVGIDAPIAQREILSVKLKDDVGQNELNFIKVGEMEDANNNVLLGIYKIDNKSIEGTEGNWIRVEIDFYNSSYINHTYGCLFVLKDMMIDDLVANFQTDSETSPSSTHNVDTVIREPDAIVITATMWHNGSNQTDFSTFESQQWEQAIDTNGDLIFADGIFVYYDAPDMPVANNGPKKNMSATSGGVFGRCKSISVSVVIRSDTDFEVTHTAGPTVATLDPNATSYYFEGFNEQKNGRSDATGNWNPSTYDLLDRSEMSGSWGTKIDVGHVRWLPGWYCDGDVGSGELKLTNKNTIAGGPNGDILPGSREINIMAFSPKNPDRERQWYEYQKGLENDMDAADDPNEPLGDINLKTYTGLLGFDLEEFCIHYDGTRGIPYSTKWGPGDAYNAQYDGVPAWEYNAAARYWWERTHQYITEEYAPDLHALMLYHHPQQPRSVNEGLERGPLYDDSTWCGVWKQQPGINPPCTSNPGPQGLTWQDDIAWLYKMQGCFDAHCYPPVTLGTDHQNINDWVTNCMENFKGISDTYGVWGFITLWPGMPGAAAFPTNTTMYRIISAIDDIRGSGPGEWENYDAIMWGWVGQGAKSGTNTSDPQNHVMKLYGITDFSATGDWIKIDGHWAKEFDPWDGAGSDKNGIGWRIRNGSEDFSDLDINFGGTNEVVWMVQETGPNKTKIIFHGDPFPGVSPPAILGDFMKPNWAISDFRVWWGVEGQNGHGFIKQLDDVLGQ